MGGIGSTRWGSGSTKSTTSKRLSVDVRKLKRSGKLVPGLHSISWDNGSAMTMMINAEVTIAQFQFAQDGQSYTPTAFIAHTKCNYGGVRPWFVCNGCERRYAVLYVSRGSIACRDCNNLLYASQIESEPDRAIRKAQELGIQLGYGPDLINGQYLHGDKRPAGMSFRAYMKFKGEYENARLRAILMV